MSLENRGRSDHVLITCLFGSQLPRPGKPYIAKESEEEDEFCFFLGTTLAAIPSLGKDLDVEETGKGLSQLLTDKWASLVKTPITSGPHGSSWWNKECQIYRDVYNLVRSKENLKAYNAFTRKARKAFFEEKIAVMMAIKRLWEGVCWTHPRAPPPYSTIQVNGVPPSGIEDLFDIMHDQFSKAAKHSPSEEDAQELLNGLSPMPTREFPPFATQEVLDAITLTGNNSAPGPDGISWELLKRAFQVQGAPEGVCHLFNRIRSSGYWPTWFKQSLCVIIPKLNKVSYNVPKAFRPISLLNTVGKLLTKVIATIAS